MTTLGLTKEEKVQLHQDIISLPRIQLRRQTHIRRSSQESEYKIQNMTAQKLNSGGEKKSILSRKRSKTISHFDFGFGSDMADEDDFERLSDTAFFDDGEYCFKYDKISTNYINLIRCYLVKNAYIEAKPRFDLNEGRRNRTSKLTNFSDHANKGCKLYRDKYLRFHSEDEETDNKINKGYLRTLYKIKKKNNIKYNQSQNRQTRKKMLAIVLSNCQFFQKNRVSKKSNSPTSVDPVLRRSLSPIKLLGLQLSEETDPLSDENSPIGLRRNTEIKKANKVLQIQPIVTSANPNLQPLNFEEASLVLSNISESNHEKMSRSQIIDKNLNKMNNSKKLIRHSMFQRSISFKEKSSVGGLKQKMGRNIFRNSQRKLELSKIKNPPTGRQNSCLNLKIFQKFERCNRVKEDQNWLFDDLVEPNSGSKINMNMKQLDQKYPLHKRENHGLLKKRLVSFRKLPIINGSQLQLARSHKLSKQSDLMDSISPAKLSNQSQLKQRAYSKFMNQKQIEHNLSDVSISEDEKTESMPDDQSLQQTKKFSSNTFGVIEQNQVNQTKTGHSPDSKNVQNKGLQVLQHNLESIPEQNDEPCSKPVSVSKKSETLSEESQSLTSSHSDTPVQKWPLNATQNKNSKFQNTSSQLQTSSLLVDQDSKIKPEKKLLKSQTQNFKMMQSSAKLQQFRDLQIGKQKSLNREEQQLASLKFLRVLGNHLKSNQAQNKETQNINLNKMQQQTISELKLTPFDTEYLKMTNMYMNYQEELDQYYNVDEGTIPQTQIQEDDEISVGERKPHQLNIDENLVMNTIGLELDNLSEKNEESCSISESLQSLQEEEQSIQIPSNTISNTSSKDKLEDKKLTQETPKSNSTHQSIAVKISPYVIKKIQNIGKYEIRSIAEVEEDHSTQHKQSLHFPQSPSQPHVYLNQVKNLQLKLDIASKYQNKIKQAKNNIVDVGEKYKTPNEQFPSKFDQDMLLSHMPHNTSNSQSSHSLNSNPTPYSIKEQDEPEVNLINLNVIQSKPELINREEEKNFKEEHKKQANSYYSSSIQSIKTDSEVSEIKYIPVFQPTPDDQKFKSSGSEVNQTIQENSQGKFLSDSGGFSQSLQVPCKFSIKNKVSSMNIWKSNAGSEHDTLGFGNRSFRSQNQELLNIGIQNFNAKINGSEMNVVKIRSINQKGVHSPKSLVHQQQIENSSRHDSLIQIQPVLCKLIKDNDNSMKRQKEASNMLLNECPTDLREEDASNISERIDQHILDDQIDRDQQHKQVSVPLMINSNNLTSSLVIESLDLKQNSPLIRKEKSIEESSIYTKSPLNNNATTFNTYHMFQSELNLNIQNSDRSSQMVLNNPNSEETKINENQATYIRFSPDFHRRSLAQMEQNMEESNEINRIHRPSLLINSQTSQEMPQNNNIKDHNNSMTHQIVPKQNKNELMRQILQEDQDKKLIDDGPSIISRNQNQQNSQFLQMKYASYNSNYAAYDTLDNQQAQIHSQQVSPPASITQSFIGDQSQRWAHMTQEYPMSQRGNKIANFNNPFQLQKQQSEPKQHEINNYQNYYNNNIQQTVDSQMKQRVIYHTMQNSRRQSPIYMRKNKKSEVNKIQRQSLTNDFLQEFKKNLKQLCQTHTEHDNTSANYVQSPSRGSDHSQEMMSRNIRWSRIQPPGVHKTISISNNNSTHRVNDLQKLRVQKYESTATVLSNTMKIPQFHKRQTGPSQIIVPSRIQFKTHCNSPTQEFNFGNQTHNTSFAAAVKQDTGQVIFRTSHIQRSNIPSRQGSVFSGRGPTSMGEYNSSQTRINRALSPPQKNKITKYEQNFINQLNTSKIRKQISSPAKRPRAQGATSKTKAPSQNISPHKSTYTQQNTADLTSLNKNLKQIYKTQFQGQVPQKQKSTNWQYDHYTQDSAQNSRSQYQSNYRY